MKPSPRSASARRSPPRSATAASTTSTPPSAGSMARTRRRRTARRWKMPSSRTWRRSRRQSATCRGMSPNHGQSRSPCPGSAGTWSRACSSAGSRPTATVRAGDTLFTLESEKATEDIECLDDGILHIPADGPRKGDVVAVGAVIGYLLATGRSRFPQRRPPADPPANRRPARAPTAVELGHAAPTRSTARPARRELAAPPRRARHRLADAKGTGASRPHPRARCLAWPTVPRGRDAPRRSRNAC